MYAASSCAIASTFASHRLTLKPLAQIPFFQGHVRNKIISIDLTNVDVMIVRYLSGNRALLSVCSDK